MAGRLPPPRRYGVYICPVCTLETTRPHRLPHNSWDTCPGQSRTRGIQALAAPKPVKTCPAPMPGRQRVCFCFNCSWQTTRLFLFQLLVADNAFVSVSIARGRQRFCFCFNGSWQTRVPHVFLVADTRAARVPRGIVSVVGYLFFFVL